MITITNVTGIGEISWSDAYIDELYDSPLRGICVRPSDSGLWLLLLRYAFL
jgi:hypothetical protein